MILEKSFQDIIGALQDFWSRQGCVILQPYDMEVGAGTFHPATTLKALGPKPWKAAFVQPSRRPTDGRYGENPNRFQHYYQFQTLIKPSPNNIQELYLESLRACGIDTILNDIRFVEDDWESPTLGASGLGWEVWCNGMEITQFTYFQQIGGIPCNPVTVELTYGLERVAMIVQKCATAYEINMNGQHGEDQITYRDVFYENEKEFSAYNFEHARVDMLKRHFEDAKEQCHLLLKEDLPLPAYDFCLKSSHIFNVLDARGALSVSERASYIAQVRELSTQCFQLYHNKISSDTEQGKEA